jgi:phosphohistidine phosphatase
VDLFFMRHAAAEPRERYTYDHQRPLTTQGRQQQHRVVQVLAPILQPLDHLLSSPLVRARQTADIVAEALGFTGQIEETSVLGADCTVSAVLDLLQGYPRPARLLCVGHEPDMSRLSAVFLDGQGRSVMAFQPGTVIGVSFAGHPAPGRGTLRLFLCPAEVLTLVPRPQAQG